MSLLGNEAPDFTLESTAGKQVTLSDTLERGPTVVIIFRGSWCSSCAEQLGTFSDLSYDLWYHHDTDILPVTSEPLGNLVEMRDRYDMKIQLLSDPDYKTTEAYSEIVEHEWREDYPRPGTFVVDTDRNVRYEQISDTPVDRTYANFVRAFIRNDYKDQYGSTSGNSV